MVLLCLVELIFRSTNNVLRLFRKSGSVPKQTARYEGKRGSRWPYPSSTLHEIFTSAYYRWSSYMNNLRAAKLRKTRALFGPSIQKHV